MMMMKRRATRKTIMSITRRTTRKTIMLITRRTTGKTIMSITRKTIIMIRRVILIMMIIKISIIKRMTMMMILIQTTLIIIENKQKNKHQQNMQYWETHYNTQNKYRDIKSKQKVKQMIKNGIQHQTRDKRETLKGNERGKGGKINKNKVGRDETTGEANTRDNG